LLLLLKVESNLREQVPLSCLHTRATRHHHRVSAGTCHLSATSNPSATPTRKPLKESFAQSHAVAAPTYTPVQLSHAGRKLFFCCCYPCGCSCKLLQPLLLLLLLMVMQRCGLVPS
jgi:hypothetical protein